MRGGRQKNRVWKLVWWATERASHASSLCPLGLEWCLRQHIRHSTSLFQRFIISWKTLYIHGFLLYMGYQVEFQR